jgi:acetylornithine deacetylase
VTSFLSNTELLSRLVAFDSVSRNSNLPIADFIAGYLERPGVRTDRVPSADNSKTNLILTAGPVTGDRAGLSLSGHMDVVPADEPEWESNPFDLTRRDDLFFGRGVADMKGFLALAMNQFAAVDPARLRHPLALIFTYDEEVGTLGARRIAEQWNRPEALPRRTIIGEPTSLKVARMHKGHIKLRLTFRGRPAHSGYPHLGYNAIEPAGKAIVALSGLRAELERERPTLGHFFDPVPFVTLNVAQVGGGVAVNIVPDLCVLDVGLRLLPGMEREPVLRRIKERVVDVLGVSPFEFELVNESPPMLVEGEAEIFKACCAEVAQAGEHTIAYTTDGGWFQRAGLECVVFGPGSIEVAHRPNESIAIDQLKAGAEILDRLVRKFCS